MLTVITKQLTYQRLHKRANFSCLFPMLCVVLLTLIATSFSEFHIPVAQPNTPFIKDSEISLQPQDVRSPYATVIDTSSTF